MISENISQNKKYRPEIDGLRAFAVIVVIINHFNKDILPNGYLGVDIFFVISGYVITSSLDGRKSTNFKDFMLGFFERRIKRLIPALIPFTIITGLLICLFNPEPYTSLVTGITSLFGLSNLYLLHRSTDYFAASTQLNVFMHTWSLDVEEQFYIFFPLLIWFSGFASKTKKGSLNLLVISSLLLFLSLSGFLFLYSRNQSAAYFLMPTRFWEMAAGCVVFLILKNNNTLIRVLKNIPPFIVFILIFIALMLPISLALQATLLVVLLSSLLICCLNKGTNLFKFFTNRLVLHIGLISYSLYLWHWTVLSISRWTIGIHLWSFPIQALIIYLLGFTSYRYIEIPFRNMEWSITKFRTILKGIFLLITTGSGLFIFQSYLKEHLYAGNYKYDHLITRGRNYLDSKNNEENIFLYNAENCHLEANINSYESIDLKHCIIKRPNQKTAFFLGNSHTDHLRETHFNLYEDNFLSIDGISVSGCVFPYVLSQTVCGEFQKKQMNRVLKNIKDNDLVVISNSYQLYKFSEGYNWFNNEKTVFAINRFYEKIKTLGANLIVFMPSPEFKVTIVDCKDNWFKIKPVEKCSISEDELRLKRKETYKLLNLLNKEIYLYDPLKAICADGICSVTDSLGKPLYVGTDHFTDYANNEFIYEHFRDYLIQNDLI